MQKILTRFKSNPDNKEQLNNARFPIYVVLENIRSLYNVGSVFRSADAARIKMLYLTGITGFPPRKEITKTALGAQDTVPWYRAEKTPPLLKSLKKEGVTIVAVEHTDKSDSIWREPFLFPVCFVFGYEIEGIDSETLNHCDCAIEIPMFGYKGSLNVAVTCGIVLFEALRQLHEQERKETATVRG
ncbi:RNA methyltransferase [bacterium]|nr:RNA methyltransferase [candidate division CSSED10-310 bacterium]